MIPFPKALIEAYPFLHVLPERPWWRPELQGCRIVYVRPDGLDFADHSQGQKRWITERSASEDRMRPLPHPGFRVGQIWGRADGVAVLIQSVDADKIPYVFLIAEPGQVKSSFLPETFCFLLYDPVCPHLAPWAPAS